MGENDMLPVRDNQVTKINLDADYEVDFVLTVNSKQDPWTNVLRITSTDGNMGTYGDRLVVVQIRPKESRLQICTDTTTRASHCHDTPALPLAAPQHVRIMVEGSRKMVDIEGQRVVDINDLGPRQRQAGASLYISDRHHAAADARVSKLRVFSGSVGRVLRLSITCNLACRKLVARSLRLRVRLLW